MTTRSRSARHARLVAAISVVAVIATACGGSGQASPGAATPRATPPSTAAPSTSPGASAPTASASPVPARPPADRPDLAAVSIALEVVAEGLDQPLFATHAGDGSGRLFVLEQAGRIRVIRDGRLEPEPFLDITGRVGAGGERGLLGLAFPPGFGTERDTLFVHYTDTEGDTTISEFRAPPPGTTADPGSERILLHEPQPYANHNGGWIGFDPDGMLLVGLGDGGSGGDPENRASRLDTILGKILRLDVLDAGGEAYAIPADNPYAGSADARQEILHSGLRNPWRAGIDPATGDLWIGDVGQGSWEEVDVARAGARGLDFGWRRWEGGHCYEPASGCDPAGVTMPVAEYPHALGCSITGGLVYRGEDVPALRGGYLFSDYCSGTLWAIDAGLDAQQAPVTLLESGRTISSFGTDAAGEAYVTDLASGTVLRIVDGG